MRWTISFLTITIAVASFEAAHDDALALQPRRKNRLVPWNQNPLRNVWKAQRILKGLHLPSATRIPRRNFSDQFIILMGERFAYEADERSAAEFSTLLQTHVQLRLTQSPKQ